MPCPSCAALPSPLQRCIAAVDYAYPWHQAVAAFKFAQQPAWAQAMSQLLLAQPDCHVLVEHCDWIVPVPLSAQRLRERGYNQAWELCRALAHRCDQTGKCLPYAITRHHVPQTQAKQSRQERLRRMHRMFALTSGNSTMWAGRRVLLVDDVMTTGATLFALAKTLQAAGASRVDALVFARTPFEG
ncbi:ComF family protein [Lampropedia puyangensis]|nr:phosphoribosyltransferase family protein [Lampropedia puyangensis]